MIRPAGAEPATAAGASLLSSITRRAAGPVRGTPAGASALAVTRCRGAVAGVPVGRGAGRGALLDHRQHLTALDGGTRLAP